MNPKNHKTLYYLLSLTVLATFFIVAGVYFLKTNGKTTEEANDENLSNVAGEAESNNENSRIEELSPDQKFYAHGIKNFENKSYDQAISDFEIAISINPKVAVYYSLKSEAEFLAGKKDDARATLEAGIENIPGNDVLNSKLDVLTKEYFQSSSFEAIRE